MRRVLTLLVLLFSSTHSFSDVVKPALIEISVHSDGEVIVDIRASIEALLTGINAQYKNTQDAPNAGEYDALRALQAPELRKAFVPFEDSLLSQVALRVDGDRIPLEFESVSIPEPGYTKVPRISTILLKGRVPFSGREITWYYPESFGDNAVRVRQVDERSDRWHWSQWQWLRSDAPSTVFPLDAVFAERPLMDTITGYIVIGFEHIVPKGLDHILFILGLFFFSLKMKPLLWQVTMFTLAHTITLGLSMNGVIELPARIVEPLIALSIVYVGVENIMAKTLHNSRLALVFAFGLLHGLGFASVLSDFGMPEDDFVTALISFNVGVELGQLTVIAAAFGIFGYWFGRKAWYRERITLPASVFISLVAAYWTVERVIA